MSDPLENIRQQIRDAVNQHHPEVLNHVEKELAVASSIDAIDGKGKALNTIFTIWQNNLGKKGHLNKSNSWIAYGIGLTEVKPDGDPLPVRRSFARASFPDVDSDFEDERREEVIDHIVDKYGRENVGNIGTYGKMHMKSAIRNLVKVVDAGGAFFKGFDEFKTANKLKGDEIIASLPQPQGNKIKVTTERGELVEIKTIQNAYDHVPDFRQHMDEHPKIMDYAKHIEGITGQFSTHASGVIIANQPLKKLAPMRPVKKKNWKGERVDALSTQFSYQDAETAGLIKFDVLAIKMLSIVKKCVKMIKKRYDVDIDIRNLPLTDKKTFQLFQTGNLIGVFQCEGWGMQKVCREIGVSCFDDIMAAIALYRPGPMVSIPEYVGRKKGEKKIEYFHPSIEPHVKNILQKTYGVLVYQEQVMLLCNALAGFSLTDAYFIIKAVGKKQIELMNSFGAAFINGCVEHGVPRPVAEQYWSKFIVPFADYGFNAAHSCCYGYNSYMTAFLKANFTKEYMVSSLNAEAERKKWEKVQKLERDLKKNNIKLLPRNIDACKMEYEIVSDGNPQTGQPAEVRPSILCQGMAHASAIEIVSKAPFKSFRDFATRCSNVVDTSSVKALIEAGFFKKEDGEKVLKDFESYRKDKKKADKKGVPSLDMMEND